MLFYNETHDKIIYSKTRILCNSQILFEIYSDNSVLNWIRYYIKTSQFIYPHQDSPKIYHINMY